MTRCLKPLAFPFIGCYGSDGGGSGHHMHSPIKKVSRVKKKKKRNLPEARDNMSQASCILI